MRLLRLGYAAYREVVVKAEETNRKTVDLINIQEDLDIILYHCPSSNIEKKSSAFLPAVSSVHDAVMFGIDI